MTFHDDGVEVVPELRVRVDGGDTGGDGADKCAQLKERLLLGGCEEAVAAEGLLLGASVFSWRWIGRLWRWCKLVFLFLCLGILAAVFVKWVGPFFIDKEVVPFINWETTTFSTPVLAVLVFASVALLPTLFLPSSPSMWVAGIIFGYGFGFLLIISAAAIGVSLPFFIGSLFLHRIRGLLEKYPKHAVILRAAGEGDWLDQLRAVVLIRISPFPYIMYNYCAVATNVKYGPYILGSLVGMAPETFVAIYTGILIQTLADASHEGHALSAPQIAFNVVGFCATVGTTILFTTYAKRKLQRLQTEELLLQ